MLFMVTVGDERQQPQNAKPATARPNRIAWMRS
jgi:hypothetical protein